MRRGSLLVVAALILAALLPASVASAAVTRIRTAGSETCIEVPGTGEYWMEDGVLYARGAVYDCVVVGTEGAQYIEGTEDVVVNFNLDTATGGGVLWGTFRTDLAALAPAGGGGFEGTWNGHWTATGWSGKAVGKGWGALDGWQMRLDLRTTGPDSVPCPGSCSAQAASTVWQEGAVRGLGDRPWAPARLERPLNAL